MRRAWRGGQEAGKVVGEKFNGIGTALSQGFGGIYSLGEQVVEYAPQAFEVAKNLYETGKKYVEGSKQFETKWSSVNEQLKNDTTTIIANWIRIFGDLDRLWTLIKLPWTIVTKLNKVQLQNPKAARPPKGVTDVWTKNGGDKEKICWECLWVILKRPRRSLGELGKMSGKTWKIKASEPEQ